MSALQDSIRIKTTSEEVFDRFKKLDKYFATRHLNQIKFVKLCGGVEGEDGVCFEECIDGKRVKFKIAKSAKGVK